MAARISQRQSFWRFSSSAFCICRSCSWSSQLPGRDGSPAGSRTVPGSRRARATSCSPAGRGSRRTTARAVGPRPSRSCRRRAGRSRRTSCSPAPAGRWCRRACGRPAPASACPRRRQRDAVADRCGSPRRTGAGSSLEQRRHQGDELRRPRELAVGRVPAAGQNDEPPLAERFLDDRGVAVLEPGQDPRVAERLGLDPAILPEMDLGEVVELGAGERGEERMVEGDLAEHRRRSRRSLPRRPRPGRPPVRPASRPGPARRPRRAPSRRRRT